MGVQKSGSGSAPTEQDALRLLQEVCAAIAARHAAADDQEASACLNATLDALSDQDRDRVRVAMQRILDVRLPPSRLPQ